MKYGFQIAALSITAALTVSFIPIAHAEEQAAQSTPTLLASAASPQSISTPEITTKTPKMATWERL